MTTRPATETAATAGTSLYWLWDAYFAIGYVVVLAMLVSQHRDAAPADRIGAATSLTLLIPWYLALGRRVMNGADAHRRGRWAYVGGVAALFTISVAFLPASAMALFALCPMMFLSLPLRPAAALVVVLNVLPPVARLLRDGPTPELAHALPFTPLGIALALLIGISVDRILRQSRERAQLIGELKASRAEGSRLSHEAGVAAERTRLAGDIHDTLAQGFTSIITLLQAAESDIGRNDSQVRRRLDLAARTARENLTEARGLIAALTPSALQSGSLDDAVRRLVQRTGDELGVPARFTVQGTIRPLPVAVEVMLLRAAQEGLSNVRKHADAGQVTVGLVYRDSTVAVTVADNGKGADMSGRDAGFGLRGMRARAEQAGGSLTIHSAPGAGTTLEVEVPA